MDPHLSQQTVGLQHTVLQLEQYVTRPTAIFRPTLPKKSEVDGEQCDQIWRFFALWATIQSWWQQLFYPNYSHC